MAGYRDLVGPSRRAADRLADVFVVEGVRALRQIVDLGWPLRSLLLLESRVSGLADLIESSGVPVYVAGRPLLDSIAGFPVHRGVLALAERPPARTPAAILAPDGPILVVEGVNDHENMGALFRNAAAFGVAAVLFDPLSADPLYRRAVRVSLGHVMRIPFARVDPWPAGLDAVRRAGLELVALSPSAPTPIDDVARSARPVAVMVGSEAGGLSPAAIAAADRVVRIPMAPGVDSLNVATAAAIALHRLAPLSWRCE